MNTFLDEFLTFLETRETRLLSWGFYDAAFTLEEIERLFEEEGTPELREAWARCAAQGWTLERVIGQMEIANLLYRAQRLPDMYRTRFGEGVRLLAGLRQIFREDQWAVAPRLVSDIKIHLMPRVYPRRDRTAEQCWESMREACANPQLQQAIFSELARNPRGKPYTFSGFQERAFAHVFRSYGQPGESGSIICAGTGSGKTKAFYVPAFLASCLELQQPPFTKIIAVYPRNVLLADQLREALAEAEKVRFLLAARGMRPLRFGALLGSTPWETAFQTRAGMRTRAEEQHGWTRGRGGFVIPYLKSPIQPERDLVWRDADRAAGRTCLYRADGSQPQPDLPDGTLALTRDELMRHPPDVLFLSLEMLNRELGNPEWSNTFGARGGGRGPRLLLLDEIHAYEGIHGAQIAWVLRRWRHWARPTSLHVVGLSATLKEAVEHLGRIAGIRRESITEFRPASDELLHEGAEYNLAVKGAPGAGTSLLSTSIQCGMLLSRLLTPRHQLPTPAGIPIAPERFFGRSVFGFTDNLDGVNRWLSDMTDAERNRLARLRLHPQYRVPPPTPSPPPAEIQRRDELGQLWELPRRIDHDLNQSLRIARCSSQDPGADANADLIIATSALEVGYDDPRVGAILQHKRPLSLASFLQRKGRAGRLRGMRPWTLVVLSEYGADRWTFQHSEQLFEPELAALQVPVRNPYILRIQSTYFLIDWLGRRIGRGSPFEFLRQPSADRSAQRAAIDLLEDFLSQGSAWREFRQDLGRLLGRTAGRMDEGLGEAEVDALLWESPRPLLRHVVPSLLRKLEAGFGYADPGRAAAKDREDRGATHPLPRYLPKATFADLDIAEVQVRLQRQGNRVDDERMSVGHALFESCPGRVSKRFSLQVGEPGFWQPVSAQLAPHETIVKPEDIYPERFDLGYEQGMRVFQPEAVDLAHRPLTVLDSSYAFWEWRNAFSPQGDGQPLPVLRGPRWRDVVRDVTAFLHRDQESVEVLRYADSAQYDIRRRNADPVRGRLLLQSADAGEPARAAAVGFRKIVDGISLRLRADHLARVPDRNPSLEARFRAEYYRDAIAESPALSDRAGRFVLDWLWQMSLAMLSATALRKGCSLEQAQGMLQGKRAEAAERVLRVVFQMSIPRPGEQDEHARLVQELRDLWHDPGVVGIMEELERTLWSPPASAYERWMRRRYVATWAQALRAAATANHPDVSEDDLETDVAWCADGSAEIYVTETQTGGLGQVETLVQQSCRHPEQFQEAFEHALLRCPRASSAELILAVLGGAMAEAPNGVLRRAFQRVREARGFRSLEGAKEELRRALESAGYPSTRSAVVGIATHILRPGSSPTTDRLLWLLNRFWRRAEARLGVAIDAGVFAFHAVERASFARRLSAHLEELSGGSAPSPGQMYAAVDQFLLRDCRDSCPECLDQPNRYNDFGRPSRELATYWLDLSTEEIAVDLCGGEWPARVVEALRRKGSVRVSVPWVEMQAVARELPWLLAEPVEVDFLLVPMSLQRVDKRGNRWELTFRLREVVHAEI
jgi:hypothetical protein